MTTFPLPFIIIQLIVNVDAFLIVSIFAFVFVFAFAFVFVFVFVLIRSSPA